MRFSKLILKFSLRKSTQKEKLSRNTSNEENCDLEPQINASDPLPAKFATTSEEFSKMVTFEDAIGDFKAIRIQKYKDIYKRLRFSLPPRRVPPAPILYSTLMRKRDLRDAMKYNLEIKLIVYSTFVQPNKTPVPEPLSNQNTVGEISGQGTSGQAPSLRTDSTTLHNWVS